MHVEKVTEDHLILDDLIEEQFQNEIREAIETVIKNERNQKIVLMRLGLFDGKPYVLREIGSHFGISHERVRQIVEASYKRIRWSCHMQVKKGYFFHPSVILYQTLQKWIMPGSDTDSLNFISLLIRLSSFSSMRLTELFARICYDYENYKIKIHSVRQILSTIQQSIYSFYSEQRRQKKIFDRIFSHVAWPAHVEKINQDEWKRLRPKRSVNSDGDGIAGNFFSKKNNATVEYESLLEYTFCQHLEQLDEVKKYVQQPFAIPYTVNEEDRIYYPDFYVLFSDDTSAVVEIKPRNDMGLFANLCKWASLQKFCQRHGFGYLILEKSRTFNQYVLRDVDEKKTSAILSAINDHSINWPELKKIKETYSIGWYDFVTIVIQNNIKWSLGPFRVERSEESTYEFVSAHKGLINNISSEHSLKDTIGQENMNRSAVRVKRRGIRKENEPHARWTNQEEQLLIKEFVNDNIAIHEIAKLHNRTVGAINSRLKKLGIVTDEG